MVDVVIKAKSILAHRVLYNGAEYKMSIAHISDDGKYVGIEPYVKEVPGTIFVSGTVEILLKEGRFLAVHHLAE